MPRGHALSRRVADRCGKSRDAGGGYKKDRQTFYKTGEQPLCAADDSVSRFHGSALLHATPNLRTPTARLYSTAMVICDTYRIGMMDFDTARTLRTPRDDYRR
ncbi:hypothetical protein [Paraburkholderia atlantica]|uniref:hypothetical protein n=1 Tax=Paraburkholderia atlantica TaxID=2654982 RepID=UPI00161C5CFA|nr:hypothetical protein [Paraburkholderia atlantica]MBB5504314.1 hypothetical protein [Paraburkholderia atlantica]